MADEKRAPYAPPASVLAVIRRMHERGLPEMLDETAMAVSGVPDSLHSRVLASLRFLGLADESGKKTELFTRLGRATSDEYSALLAEIVQAAYAPVFAFGIDPSQDNDQRVMDAFRSYEPMGQREGMARLFRGLCQEAGLAPAGTGTESRPPRPRPPQSRPARAAAPRKAMTVTGFAPSVTVAPAEGRVDLRPILQMVEALPVEGWWTADRRERWLRMLASAVDYAIDLREAAPVREVADPPVE